VTDDLEDLLDALDEARVVDRFSQLDVPKVPGALGHVLSACLALEVAVDGTEARIVETILTRLGPRFVHGLGVEHLADAHGLDLLRREDTKLYLSDRLKRRARVREVEVRHFRR
jgi:hypothetical protein